MAGSDSRYMFCEKCKGVHRVMDTCECETWKWEEYAMTLTPDDPVATYGNGDPVSHPPHYTQHPSGVECIQITEHMGFNLGNATKYIFRAGEKEGNAYVQDLEKAAWYINREIERFKKCGTILQWKVEV